MLHQNSLSIGAVRLTLVRGVITYTKDELMNLDVEEIDRKQGLMWGWHQKMKIYSRDPYNPYDTNRMSEFSRVSNEAKAILDNLKQYMKDNNSDVFDYAKRNKAYFELVIDSMTVNAERMMLDPGRHQKHRMKQCFAIVNTMLNSRLDIQRYYKIRYLYTWTLHFEVGYLSQEILRHYTVVIDLFHLVVTRFENQPFDDHTPSRYMLYMYSVILYECKMIIKFCRMLHEVEKKYSNFVDQTKLWRDTPGSSEQLLKAQQRKKEENALALANYNSELQRARADRLKAIKKKNKKALSAFKGSLGGDGKQSGNKMSGSGFGASSSKVRGKWSPADYFYASFNASNQKKSVFPHIYGWSIENFPNK